MPFGSRLAFRSLAIFSSLQLLLLLGDLLPRLVLLQRLRVRFLGRISSLVSARRPPAKPAS